MLNCSNQRYLSYLYLVLMSSWQGTAVQVPRVCSSDPSPGVAMASHTITRSKPSQGELVEQAAQRLPAYPMIDIGVNLMDRSFDKVRPQLGLGFVCQ